MPVYDPPAWGIHLNNLAMFFAVALMGAGQSKGHARAWLRHPMLTGVLVWAFAHLLVNGDAASLILFGWMAVWALASMALINAREPAWVRPAPGPWTRRPPPARHRRRALRGDRHRPHLARLLAASRR